MAKKKTDHIVMRNGGFFCSNCGDTHKIAMPIAIQMFTASSDAFIKLHKDCIKTWVEPTPDPSQSEDSKAKFWLRHGERGASSECIFQTISGIDINASNSHPYDAGDFKRCHGLLLMVPEFRSKLHLMKPLSKAWSNLVDNWDMLTEMLNEQLESSRPNGLSKEINKLIN
jgi:hypothetical protein